MGIRARFILLHKGGRTKKKGDSTSDPKGESHLTPLTSL